MPGKLQMRKGCTTGLLAPVLLGMAFGALCLDSVAGTEIKVGMGTALSGPAQALGQGE